mgnify:CR=1 FL=1
MAKDPFWEVNNIWWTQSGKNINISDVNDDVQNLRDSSPEASSSEVSFLM